MTTKLTWIFLTLSFATGMMVAQAMGQSAESSTENGVWRSADRSATSRLGAAARSQQDRSDALHPTSSTSPAAPLVSAARVTQGNGTLPNEHGQVWREYDIASYTSRLEASANPRQAIIDWILRETGTEIWFSEPLGILSANRTTLRVYHTPEMQARVADVVDRFVASKAKTYVMGARLVTITNPNWRARALPIMQSVDVQTPGVEAWLLTKENAALLLADLRKRTDFREHSAPSLAIHNGQTGTIGAMHPRPYARSVRLRTDVWQGFEKEMGQVEEGYQLSLSPLLSRDGQMIDVSIKCKVEYIEKMTPVGIEIPTTANPRQRVQIEVPQVSSWQLNELFRWPADQVLLISRGIVAMPSQGRPTTSGIAAIFSPEMPRADTLLLLETKGEALLGSTGQNLRTGAVNSRGRY